MKTMVKVAKEIFCCLVILSLLLLSQCMKEKTNVSLVEEPQTGTGEATKACAPSFEYTDVGPIIDKEELKDTLPSISAQDTIADSTAILTKDGKVRIYFLGLGRPALRAISDDGINFVYEGISFEKDYFGHKKAIRLDDGRIRFFGISTKTDGIISAISDDEGVTFTLEEGERITKEQSGLEKRLDQLAVVSLPDGGYRGYFTDLGTPGTIGGHKLLSAVSEDMLQWTVEDGVRIGEGAEVLTESAEQADALLTDAGVTVFYFKANPSQPNLYPHGLYYSTAEDGLTFTTECFLEDAGNGPDVLQLSDGSYLLYSDFSSEELGFHTRVGKLEMKG